MRPQELPSGPRVFQHRCGNMSISMANSAINGPTEIHFPHLAGMPRDADKGTLGSPSFLIPSEARVSGTCTTSARSKLPPPQWRLGRNIVWSRLHDWLVVWLPWILFSHILGMSSSQLTNIFQRGWNHQPVKWWSFHHGFHYALNCRAMPRNIRDSQAAIGLSHAFSASIGDLMVIPATEVSNRILAPCWGYHHEQIGGLKSGEHFWQRRLPKGTCTIEENARMNTHVPAILEVHQNIMILSMVVWLLISDHMCLMFMCSSFQEYSTTFF